MMESEAIQGEVPLTSTTVARSSCTSVCYCFDFDKSTEYINYVKVNKPDYFQNFNKNIRLKVLTMDDRKSAVKIMALSFSGTNDCAPELAIHWSLGPELANFDDKNRLEVLEFIMDYVFLLTVNYGCCYSITLKPSNQIAAVICTMPPGSVMNGIVETSWRQIATMSRLRKLPPYLGNKEKYPSGDEIDLRFESLFANLNKFHRLYASSMHWYTYVLAVDPSHQGKGYGSKLLNFISVLADLENVPCYLEATGEKNTAFYENHGYVNKTGSYRIEVQAKPDIQPIQFTGGAFVRLN